MGELLSEQHINLNMPTKKYTPADQYTVGPGVVVQELYKASGLFLTGNRPYATTYTVNRGKGSNIVYENGTGGSFQPCEHVTDEWTSMGEADGFAQAGTPSNPALTGNITLSICRGLPRYALGQAAGNLVTAFNSVKDLNCDGIDWDGLSARAFQAMRPSMKGDTSLLNFLYELKDFKHLAKAALGAFRRKESVIYSILNEIGITKQAFLTSVSKGQTLQHLSQLYLSYNFAWKPFVSDVVSLVSALSGFEKKWKEFVKRANTPQQRYWGYTIPGTESAESVYYTTDVGPPGGSVGFFTPYARIRVRKKSDDGIRYHATMRYRYKLPSDALSAAGLIKGLLDSLGVRRNPAILWNAIPYTFILDWVVNVSKLLDSVSLDNLEVQTEITEFCHSAKRSKTVSMTMQTNYMIGGTEHWTAERDMRVLKRKHYRRAVGFPSRSALLAVSGLSGREISLLLALGLSKR